MPMRVSADGRRYRVVCSCWLVGRLIMIAVGRMLVVVVGWMMQSSQMQSEYLLLFTSMTRDDGQRNHLYKTMMDDFYLPPSLMSAAYLYGNGLAHFLKLWIADWFHVQLIHLPITIIHCFIWFFIILEKVARRTSSVAMADAFPFPSFAMAVPIVWMEGMKAIVPSLVSLLPLYFIIRLLVGQNLS